MPKRAHISNGSILYLSIPDLNKLMVIGGTSAGTTLDDVEVIDFSQDSLDCGVSASYPYEIEGATAMHYRGVSPWVCGGNGRSSPFEELTPLADCIRYDQDTKTWTYSAGMNMPRMDAAGLAINSESAWVTGGTDGMNVTATTELYQVGIEV